jgi:hypothetical protein
MKFLVNEVFPDAIAIRIVQDNLNRYQRFTLQSLALKEVRRILDCLEFYYTPKHCSWLNMAELELSVLARQCLDHCISDKQTLTAEVEAWQQSRNTQSSPVDWRFTIQDVRIKLKGLYPSILA